MCILLHNNRVGISGNIIYLFCPNTDTKFREPYHLNHVIPRLAEICHHSEQLRKKYTSE